MGTFVKNCLNFSRTDIVQEHRKGYLIFDEHFIPPFQGACIGMAIAQNHTNTIGTGLGRICSLLKAPADHPLPLLRPWSDTVIVPNEFNPRFPVYFLVNEATLG